MNQAANLTLFLDESGDLGFDETKKSRSSFFVMTILVCEGIECLKLFKRAVRRTIKNKINHGKSGYQQKLHELKGAHTTLSIKRYFFKFVPESNWKIYTIILDKNEVPIYYKQPSMHDKLYNQIACLVLEKISFLQNIKSVHFIVDRCKNKNGIALFNTSIKRQLHSQIAMGIELDISHLDSYAHYGLQVVDLFCWGIARKYHNRDEDWYQLFESKIISEEKINLKEGEPFNISYPRAITNR